MGSGLKKCISKPNALVIETRHCETHRAKCRPTAGRRNAVKRGNGEEASNSIQRSGFDAGSSTALKGPHGEGPDSRNPAA